MRYDIYKLWSRDKQIHRWAFSCVLFSNFWLQQPRKGNTIINKHHKWNLKSLRNIEIVNTANCNSSSQLFAK